MMPRKYTKKTERSRKTKEQIKFAVTCVLKDGMKIRRVADDLGFSFSSLQRHVKKAKSLPVEEQDNYEYEANSSSRQVFNAEREKLLCEYLQTCSKMHHGLDTKQTRVFAYEFAKRLGIAYPREWDEHKSAGRDWLLLGYTKFQCQIFQYL
jgi:transposase